MPFFCVLFINSNRSYLFTHTNWLTVFCSVVLRTRWFVSRSTPYFSICQNVCAHSVWVLSEIHITYVVTFILATFIWAHAVLDRISVASFILSFHAIVITKRLFPFDSNFSEIFRCFTAIWTTFLNKYFFLLLSSFLQMKMYYVTQSCGHRIGLCA